MKQRAAKQGKERRDRPGRDHAPQASNDTDARKGDRRSADRLPDGQRFGRGSGQALSRLKMLERRWAWTEIVQHPD
jgi:hypothetical protein